MSDLPYWNRYWSFCLCSIPGFCRLKTTGRWSLPCDSARVHQALNHARSIELSVSPCCVPGCVGLAVDTGVKRTSLSTTSSAHPCWLVPCWSHRLDRALKSPHYHNCVSQFVFHLPKEIPTCIHPPFHLHLVVQVEGWMYALMRIRDLCLSSGFSIRMACNSRELVDHLSKLSKDIVLLRWLRTTNTIAIPRPSCPWMTVKP